MTKKFVIALAVVALVAGACAKKGYNSDSSKGDSDSGYKTSNEYNTGGTAKESSGSGDAVTIKDVSFSPTTLKASVGAEVTWTNKDSFMHTVTSGTPDAPDNKFDLTLDASGKKSFKFEAAGTFKYFCKIHNQMRAEIEVS
ncbi:MAG: plastocyanin/azurin family copper-binding protein [Actinomycetota bacterium]|nr:cupredoxin domain-containing protein [Actinomycetota bacterium]